MPTLRGNIAANFVGRGWLLLTSLLCVPLYIRFLGIEAYGLVGFFATLSATLSLLDFGLSATINRELARYSATSDNPDTARDLARTLEVLYWSVGLAIGAATLWASPWIATNWVKVSTLSTAAVLQATGMMGIVVALQWPIGLYTGGLMGLERQVLLNLLAAIFGTMRSLGVVLVLWLVQPTITAYFIWQILVSVVQTLTFTIIFWRILPAGSRIARFDLRLLRGVWRFTAGISATAVVTFCLSQLDKIVLSKVLPLEKFGYYVVANQVNTALRMLSTSIFNALMPRFSSLVAKKDFHSLRNLYHRGSQLVALAVLPASAVVGLFSFELIRIWTHSDPIAHAAAPIASLLVLGSTFNSMMGIPYDLTVAHGWVRMGLYQNVISAVFQVPAMILLTTRLGGIGAAIVWVILNAGYVLISAPIIHRRLLQHELRTWYLLDNGLPFAISLLIVGLAWWVTPRSLPAWQTLSILGATFALALAACVLCMPYFRDRVFARLGLARRKQQ